MTYHKIKNVEKTVCTAEQKIAYNLAFANHINHGTKYNELSCTIAKEEAVFKMIASDMKCFKLSYTYKEGQYNEDAIFSALRSGLKNYMDKPFIANNYEEIGKTFPANYLN